MRKRDIIWIAITLAVLIAALPTAWANGPNCTWGISTLRGDAKYPPGWEHLGGTLDIRRPFVQLHSDGTRLFIKGFEFEVHNSSTIGENNDPNPLMEGVLGAVVSYLPPDSDKRALRIIPYTHIFEKGAADYFQVQFSPGINSGYVRLTANIPVEEEYIPAGAGDLALLLIYRGTFESATPLALGLGGYFFDQERQHNTRLAFYRQYGGPPEIGAFNPSNIFTVLPSGEDLRSITSASSQIPQTGDIYTAYFDPGWSPDGARLAMQKAFCSELVVNSMGLPGNECEEQNWMQDIIIIDQSAGPPNPDAPAQVLRIEYSDYPEFADQTGRWTDLGGPTFSPDGKKLVCISQLVADETLWRFDLESPNLDKEVIGGFFQDDGGIWRTIWFQKQLIGGFADWHPEGDIIAYSFHPADYLDETGIGNIYEKRNIHTIASDGTQDTAVTADDYFNLQQDWSPDGNWLVFSSNLSSSDPTAKHNGCQDIWVIDRNGQNKIMVYDGADSCWTPSFSPDGTRIAFSMEGRICSVDLAGQNFKTIYQRPGGSPDLVHSAKWSPYLNAHTPTVILEADTLVAVRSGSTISNVTLTWASSNADRIVINNGVGEQSSLTGSTTVTPLNLEAEAPYMLTYTVTAYNWAGKATAGVYIRVIDE
ncbi:MAG: hypothetical protein PVH87_17140 [Desulfobacteraceae bacterium]|jgi:Tol biopolymer transport system component